MAKQKYIPCDIYRRGVTVFIGTYAEMVAWAKKEFTDLRYKDFLYGMEQLQGGYMDTHYDCGSCVVRIPSFPTTPEESAALGHEILHATHYILSYCGVEFVWKGNNEAYTYLFEWLQQNALTEDGYEEVSDCTTQSDTLSDDEEVTSS